MAKITAPSDVRIASLKSKKAEAFDPMAAGGGTPWEDRGSIGTAKAFFLTCFMSMKSPRVLFGSIQRPDTTGDAMRFAVGCGLLWLAAVVIHALLQLVLVVTQERSGVAYSTFLIQYGAMALGAVAGTVILMRLAAQILHKLLQAERKGNVPSSLTVNLAAYCLGPSLLALIPYVGPPLAAIGILWLLIVSCTARQQIPSGSAVTCSMIAFGAAALIVVVVWLLWWWLGWQQWYEILPPPREIRVRSI